MDASRGRRGTHVYKHCFFNIPTNMHALHKQIATTVQSSYNFTMQLPRKYRTLNLSPKRKHRAISHTQCAAKVQALCKHRTLNVPTKCKHRAISHAQSVAKVQAPRKYRTLNVLTKCKRYASIVRSMCRQSASTAQISHAQCADKMQALCKHRTLNLSPKHKHCANNTLFADFSAPFLAEFAFPSRFFLSA